MKERIVIRCEYSRCESKKGFGGNWKAVYVLKNAVDLHGNPICDLFTFDGISGIKGKKFKEGDILQMLVSIETNQKGGVKISRPANIEKVEGQL